MVLGNIIESVLGVRERALEQREILFLQQYQAMISMAKSLGEFVNLAYQFIHYTDALLADPVSEWVTFVRRFQV